MEDEKQTQDSSAETSEQQETEETSQKEESKKVPYERFKEVVDEKNELKSKLKEDLKKEREKQSSDSKPQTEAKITELEFRLNNVDKQYTDDEMEHIKSRARRDDVSLKEAAEKEDDYIQYKREKVAKSKQTPGPSSASQSEKKSAKDIRDMDKDEFYEYAEKQEKRGESGV